MIRLGLTNEPKWLDLLDGVRVKVRPFSSAAFFAAQTAMTLTSVEGLAADQANGTRGLAFVKSLARFAIIEWEGVCDADGKPIAVTPETVDALMDIWQAATAFEALYQRPIDDLRDEKNGSGPAPNGISAGAANIADPAASPAGNALTS